MEGPARYYHIRWNDNRDWSHDQARRFFFVSCYGDEQDLSAYSGEAEQCGVDVDSYIQNFFENGLAELDITEEEAKKTASKMFFVLYEANSHIRILEIPELNNVQVNTIQVSESTFSVSLKLSGRLSRKLRASLEYWGWKKNGKVWARNFTL